MINDEEGLDLIKEKKQKIPTIRINPLQENRKFKLQMIVLVFLSLTYLLIFIFSCVFHIIIPGFNGLCNQQQDQVISYSQIPQFNNLFIYITSTETYKVNHNLTNSFEILYNPQIDIDKQLFDKIEQIHEQNETTQLLNNRIQQSNYHYKNVFIIGLEDNGIETIQISQKLNSKENKQMFLSKYSIFNLINKDSNIILITINSSIVDVKKNLTTNNNNIELYFLTNDKTIVKQYQKEQFNIIYTENEKVQNELIMQIINHYIIN